MPTPAEYLEELQRAHSMQRRGKPLDAAAMEESFSRQSFQDYLLQMAGGDPARVVKYEEHFLERLREAEASRPTPYEDPGSYRLMLNLASRLETAAEATLEKRREIPTFGTLPIGQLNAMAIRVPDSAEHLIVFNEGVFGFANLFTKAVTASLPMTTGEDGWIEFSTDLDKVEKLLADDGKSLERLDEFLAAYLLEGHPHAARQYFLDAKRSTLSGTLLSAFELFIFGHELGHVFAGHLDTPEVARHRLGPEDVERLSPSWEAEFEADFVGLMLTMRVMLDDGFDLSLSYLGIDLTFSAMQLLENARATLLFGEVRERPASASHPPPAMRREMLRRHLALIDEDKAEHAEEFASIAEQLIAMMWTRIEPAFAQRHASGARPAPAWV